MNPAHSEYCTWKDFAISGIICESALPRPFIRKRRSGGPRRLLKALLKPVKSALHVSQNLKIQGLDDLRLLLAHFYIVVKAGRGIDLKDPIRLGFLANVALHHEIYATESQAHIASQFHDESPKRWVYLAGYVNSVSTS